MLVVRVLLQVKPEHRAQFMTIMNDDMPQSKQFDGCQRFQWFVDVDNPNAFILYEEWESQAQFEIYRDSEYLKGRGEQIFPLLDGKPDSAYFQASLLA